VSEHRDVAPLGYSKGRFGGIYLEIVEIVLSFSAVYAAVPMATRFSVLEVLFGDRYREHEIFR
jgi:hypothetical protein